MASSDWAYFRDHVDWRKLELTLRALARGPLRARLDLVSPGGTLRIEARATRSQGRTPGGSPVDWVFVSWRGNQFPSPVRVDGQGRNICDAAKYLITGK